MRVVVRSPRASCRDTWCAPAAKVGSAPRVLGGTIRAALGAVPDFPSIRWFLHSCLGLQCLK